MEFQMPSTFDKLDGLCKLLTPSTGKDADQIQSDAANRGIEMLFINGSVLSTAALERNLRIGEKLGFCSESRGVYFLTPRGKTFREASDKSGPLFEACKEAMRSNFKPYTDVRRSIQKLSGNSASTWGAILSDLELSLSAKEEKMFKTLLGLISTSGKLRRRMHLYYEA